jgi:hypothetical protein
MGRDALTDHGGVVVLLWEFRLRLCGFSGWVEEDGYKTLTHPP